MIVENFKPASLAIAGWPRHYLLLKISISNIATSSLQHAEFVEYFSLGDIAHLFLLLFPFLFRFYFFLRLFRFYHFLRFVSCFFLRFTPFIFFTDAN